MSRVWFHTQVIYIYIPSVNPQIRILSPFKETFIDKGLKEERKHLDRDTREEKQRKLQETIFQITISFFLILISSYSCQGGKYMYLYNR